MNTATLFRPFQRALFLLEEALFPRFCLICQSEGSFLCSSCESVLSQSIRSSQVCGHCGARETPLGAICFDCVGTTSCDGVFAALHYDRPDVARLIHTFKYRFVRDLARPLGSLVASAVLQSELPFPDAIIPVPLHPRRERWRGWNQSALLAESLVKNLPEELSPLPTNDLMVRTRFTTPQMSIKNKALRAKNIEGAFRITSKIPDATLPFDIAGKRIWLVDDVAASGSTLSACANVLKIRGAREVFGIVVAR